MRKLFILILFMALFTPKFALASNASQTWAQDYIHTLNENGLYGIEENYGEPIKTSEAILVLSSLEPSMDYSVYANDDPITRADMVGLLTDDGEWDTVELSSFTDVNDDLLAKDISVLSAKGVIQGYPDGSFKPERFITKAEFAVIAVRLGGLELIEKPQLPVKNIIAAPYISQLSPLSAPTGCEATSLLMGLKAKGYAEKVTLKEFLDDMPKSKTNNPDTGFVGSPYKIDPTKKTRTTIHPAPLVAWASKYGNIENFSGKSVNDIQYEVLSGNPVVCYMTMWWEKPFYRTYSIEGKTRRLLSNNHVILVTGYDKSTDKYYITDPYNSKDIKNELRYWVDGETFKTIYNERKHALVIR